MDSGANVCTLGAMMLCGVPVADPALLALARLVRDAGFGDTAERLEDAWRLETKVVALTIDEREEFFARSRSRPTASPSSVERSCATENGA